MQHKLILFFSCTTAALCLSALPSFGQQVDIQGKVNHKLKAYFYVKPAPKSNVDATTSLMGTSSENQSLPLWTFFTESSRDHNGYSGVMVGRDPFSGGQTADAKTYIIPLIIKTNRIVTAVNSDGSFNTKPGVTVFNPTVADNTCLAAPNNVPATLYEQSPIFQKATFDFGGTVVGHTQYVDAFQRANFWQVDDHSSYHVLLDPVIRLKAVEINVPGAHGAAVPPSIFLPAPCGPLGVIDINWFDAYLDSTVLPALAKEGVSPSNFPVFPLYNVVQSVGTPGFDDCCVIGYHGTTGYPIQTYSPVDFDSTGLFGFDFMNTYAASHEVAEWVNDPFGDNPTPPWGHVGQVGGCQNNLEVGDPLTGTESIRIDMPNHFTYHLQELAFFSWFYGAPSIGINGWYSDNDTFTTDAGPPCQ